MEVRQATYCLRRTRDGPRQAHLSQVLELGIVERKEWQKAAGEITHLFCDASSTPPYLGAVACIKGEWFWTHMAVPASVLGAFRRRKDVYRARCSVCV